MARRPFPQGALGSCPGRQFHPEVLPQVEDEGVGQGTGEGGPGGGSLAGLAEGCLDLDGIEDALSMALGRVLASKVGLQARFGQPGAGQGGIAPGLQGGAQAVGSAKQTGQTVSRISKTVLETAQGGPLGLIELTVIAVEVVGLDELVQLDAPGGVGVAVQVEEQAAALGL